MHRSSFRVLLVSLAAFSCVGAVCGWGAPIEGVATHCPPRKIDCGPGCIDEGETCCDDTASGGTSRCPTAGQGIGHVCVARGSGSCSAGGTTKFCCGANGEGGGSIDLPAPATPGGDPGVFCGTVVQRTGTECCTFIDAKQICRRMPNRGGSGTGGGGGGGGTSGTCSGGWLGSLVTCSPLGTGGSCSCSTASKNTCITKQAFESGTGLAFPAACKPSGGTNCASTSSGVKLIHPCCPGLSCKIGSVCGSSASGGSCQ